MTCKNILRFSFYFILLNSCSDDNNVNSDNNEGTIDITIDKSLVQKGPFVQGSTISLQELNDDLTLSGNVYNTETIDDFGSFDVNATLANDKVDISATGFYFNEVSGELSNAPLTLRTFVEFRNNQKLNLNILTTIARQRIKFLMTNESLAFSDAKEQAEKETLAAFNIPQSLHSDLTSFEEMDISQDNQSNAILLAISAVVQGNNSVAELGEFISKLSEDLKEDGVISSDLLSEEIIENSKQLDFDQIKKNLEQRFTALDVPFSIPNFKQFVDSDGDGTVNLIDVVLVAPLELTNNSKPEFDWEGSSIENTKYHFQLSDDENFNNLLMDQDDLQGTSLTSEVLLENNKAYWWRVSYTQEDGSESLWNEAFFKFEIDIVDIISPLFNSTVLESPRFEWENNILSNVTYQIQVADDIDFNSIVFEQSSLTESNIQTSLILQQVNQNYYWRVRIIDANGIPGTWVTSIFYFEIQPPIISGRISDSDFNIYEIIYDEQNNPDYVGFNLEVNISNNPDLNPIIKEIKNLEVELNNTYPIWNAPTDGYGIYTYRVRLINPEGIAGPWALEESFDIYEPEVILTEIDLTSLNPTIKWSHGGSIPTTYNYKIVIARNADFTDIIEESMQQVVEDTATQFPSYTIINTLNQGILYHYKVSIINPEGGEITSEVSSFVIQL
ncbi:hypothetical protein [Aquimarina spongiae]|uniref:Fibronectin type-III domain-containing protein n=1 Tax=Aquimarina spongiae TaxID=570521 RepID=A0A1M6K351_9FLAO|nr:hypothetical protein [Aquimarina spongiae]SHJ53325.1 hypothetical protein SAMN04488508_11049 [Aquimarina spongiae]